MIWLGRFDVDAEQAFRNKITDNYEWHRRIWKECFATDPAAKRDFLTRIDRADRSFRVWIVSAREPLRPAWAEDGSFGARIVPDEFFRRRYYRFDLRVNPTRCVDRLDSEGNILKRAGGVHSKGRRVPIVKQDELREWISRKAGVRARDETLQKDIPGGFRIVEERLMEVSPAVEHHFRKREHAAYHAGVDFRGILEITDPERFIETYRAGLGGAKAFGFGLFLLAPMKSDIFTTHQEGSKQ